MKYRECVSKLYEVLSTVAKAEKHNWLDCLYANPTNSEKGDQKGKTLLDVTAFTEIQSRKFDEVDAEDISACVRGLEVKLCQHIKCQLVGINTDFS